MTACVAAPTLPLLLRESSALEALADELMWEPCDPDNARLLMLWVAGVLTGVKCALFAIDERTTVPVLPTSLDAPVRPEAAPPASASLDLALTLVPRLTVSE